MRTYDPSPITIQEIKRICRKREPASRKDIVKTYVCQYNFSKSLPLLYRAIKCFVLPSINGEANYHCIAEQDEPIAYIPIRYERLCFYIGYDLKKAAELIAQSREYIIYQDRIMDSYADYLAYRLNRQNIRFDRKKLQIRCYVQTQQKEIELINVLNYYIKKTQKWKQKILNP